MSIAQEGTLVTIATALVETRLKIGQEAQKVSPPPSLSPKENNFFIL